MKLLNEKPLKQITIRDIVDDCGVNRNTFYYHFHDIPDLIDDIIRRSTGSIIAENPQINSIEECLNAIVALSLENHRAILHVYRSVNRDLFEQYQWRICNYAVSSYLGGVLKDKKISEEDRRVLFTYATCLSFGLVIGWLESGMKEDIHKLIHRICELKQGGLEKMIEMCEES
ncbi:MAG: TetR/AcrR family transcriptional regulator [Candidatus Limivicinus sp.]